MDNHDSHYLDIGTQGEAFVAQWLQQYGWQILAQRWRCRWGEIDVIAYLSQLRSGSEGKGWSWQEATVGVAQAPTLAFIEVKTRSLGNWDADGRLAITPSKRTKIIHAAQLYLAQHPQYEEAVCRFDVALVMHTASQQMGRHTRSHVSQPITFQIQEYIVNAWDA